MNTIKIEKGNALMVAHRGVSGLETENTNAAFIAAGNRTYWGVETDVHPTADGKMVLIHDKTTKRVSEVEVNVEESRAEDLHSVQLWDVYADKAPRSDLRLPFLNEYVRICKKYEKVCVLELKDQFSEEDVVRLLEVVRAEDYAEGMVYITFHAQNLVYLRRHEPDCTVQYLSSKMTDEVLALAKENGYDLDIRWDAITEDWVKQIKAAGIKLNVWTVDDKELAEKLISWGVDIITTNILE